MNNLNSIVKWIEGVFNHLFAYGDVLFGKYSKLVMLTIMLWVAKDVFKFHLNIKRGH